MRISILLIILLLLVPITSAATITNAQISNDQITITGSGFGSKIPADPVVWDNMENWIEGVEPQNQNSNIGTWDYSGANEYYANDAIVSTYKVYDGAQSAFLGFKHSNPFSDEASNSLMKRDRTWTNYYVDYKIYYPRRNGDPGNLKWFRNYGNNFGITRTWQSVSPSDNQGQLQYSYDNNYNIDYTTQFIDEFFDNWNHQQVLFRGGASPPGTARFVSYINAGSPESDISQSYSTSGGVYELLIMQYLATGSRFEVFTPADPEIYLDNVYVDDTWKRVEIGNAATYAGSTHREIQIPTSWSDGSITLDLNLGSFTQTEINNGLYLFVIDENNNVIGSRQITIPAQELIGETLPVCGNNVCEPGEKNTNCPADCGDLGVCGNGIVEPDETCDPNHPLLVDCSDFERWNPDIGADQTFTGGQISCYNTCKRYDTTQCDYSGSLTNPVNTNPTIVSLNDYFYHARNLRVTGLHFGEPFTSIELCDSATKPANCVTQNEVRVEEIPAGNYRGPNHAVVEFVADHGTFTETDFDNGLYIIVGTSEGDTNGFRVTKPPVFPTLNNPNPGEPYITNVPTLQDDSLVTINGLDFGTKADPEPHLWDDLSSYSGLNNGDVIPVQTTGCANCPWRDYWYWNAPEYYTGSNARVPDNPYYSAPQGAAGFRGYHDAGFLETDKVYISWWLRSDHNLFDRIDSPDPTFNKLIRYTAGFGSDEWEEQIEIEPQLIYGTENGCAADGGWDTFGDTFYGALDTNNWVNIELVLDGGGDLSSGSGSFDVYFNKVRVGGGETLYSCFGMLDYIHVWGSDPVSPSHYPTDVEVLFGDFYWDNSWARVELCDNSNYNSVTHCELQIPQSWNEDNVQINVKIGSFTQSDIDNGLYLFVIDENGQVSDGYRVTVNSAPVCDNDLVCEPGQGETYLNCPSDCINPCGNGQIDSGEECDGSNLSGESCVSLGYESGVLSCDSSCSFDENACVLPPQSEWIIDNGDVGTSSTGVWSVGSGFPGFYGSDYLYSDANAGNTYEWELSSAEGIFEVAISWSYDAGRPDDNTVNIYDGTLLLDSQNINQEIDDGGFYVLGEYSFTDSVRVELISGSDFEGASADAVNFTRTGNLPTCNPTNPLTIEDRTIEPTACDGENNDCDQYTDEFCYGDATGNGIRDINDLIEITSTYGKNNQTAAYNPHHDVNEDGQTNILDLTHTATRYGNQTTE